MVPGRLADPMRPLLADNRGVTRLAPPAGTHDPVTSDHELGRRYRSHPARLLVVLGLVAIVVGSLRPWIEGADFMGRPFALSGLTRTSDGWFLILGAIGLTWLVMNRAAAEGTLAVVRAAPIGVAVYLVAAANWAYGDATMLAREAEVEGGAASIVTGFWVAMGGTGLCVVGATWLTVADLLRRGGWMTRAEIASALSPLNVLPALAVVIGSIGGMAASVWLAVALFPDSRLAWIYFLVAILGFVLGGGVGYRLGKGLAGRMRAIGSRHL